MKASASKRLATAGEPKTPKIIKILTVTAIVVVAITGALVYRNHQNNMEAERAFEADKAKFAKFEQDVRLVKTNIESKLQPGDTVTLGKSCAYTAAKFERGTLRCGVYLHVVYTDNATDKISDIKEAALQTGRFNGKSPTEIVSRDAINSKTRTEVSLYKSRSDHDFCTIYQTDYGLAEYQIACSEAVKKPIYHVRDNLY